MTREEAIDVLKHNYPSSCYGDLCKAVDMAIKALEQPEPCEDTISRQAAIRSAHKNYDTILDFKSNGRTVADSFEDIINALPSAQPEIVYCKDCQLRCEDYYTKNIHGTVLYYCSQLSQMIEADFYCGYAERRTNGET